MDRPVASNSGRKRRTRNRGAARALAASLSEQDEITPAEDAVAPAIATTASTAVVEPPSLPDQEQSSEPDFCVEAAAAGEGAAAPASPPPQEQCGHTHEEEDAAVLQQQDAEEQGGAAPQSGSIDFQATFSAGGIGIKLSKPSDDQYAHVKQVMPRGPADTAGVQIGDKLISIGGEDQRVGAQLALQSTVRRVQSSLQASEHAVYIFRRG